MMNVTTTVTDRATPVVVAIGESVKPERLKPVIGRAVVNKFRAHLFECDRAKPNVLGGTRTQFYANAARGTHFDVLPDGVQISINHVGLRQRVVGGTITPKSGKKYLTIPARAEAHGKRASEFNDLVVVFGRGGQPVALARALQTSLRISRAPASRVVGGTRRTQGETQGGEIMFWLKKSVTQQGDPSVIPSAFEIAAAAVSAVNADRDRLVEAARARARSAPAKS